MAWKKVIFSGSTAELDSLTVDNTVTANSFVGSGASLTGVSADSVSFTNITNKPTLVSQSAQIDFNSIQNTSNIVSNSAQIDFNSIQNTANIVSSSTQVDFNSIQNTANIVSNSAQINYTEVNSIPAGIVSSSTQIQNIINNNNVLPAGTVSSSAQVSFADITNKPTNFTGSYTELSNIPSGILSSSTQVVDSLPAGTVSGSSQISFTNISNKPAGLVSASNQINFNNITGKPGGLVSSSTQVVDSLPAGTLSSSAQITETDTSRVVVTTGSFSYDLTLLPTDGHNLYFGAFDTQSMKLLGAQGLQGVPTHFYFSGSMRDRNLGNEGEYVTVGPNKGLRSSAFPANVVSSSTQVASLLPAGTISGSAQIDTLFNQDGVVSSSAQVNTLLGQATSNVVINEAGNDVDFRVESDNNTHALFVNGATAQVGIRNSTPRAALDVRGKISGSTLSIAGGDVTFGGLQNDSSETTLVVYNGDNQLRYREAGDGAFLDTAAIADGGTGLATADQIHTFVTSQGYTTLSDLPAGIISSSTQINALSGVTADNVPFSGITSVPTLVSGSGQIAIGSTTGTLAVNKGGTGATTAAAARTNLGVDAAGTDNSTDVTLTGTPDYITISGQVITRNQIDLANDVTGTLPAGNVGNLTAAKITDFDSNVVSNLPAGTVSSSTQVTNLIADGGILPAGTVSGSAQTVAHLTSADVTVNDMTVSGDLTVSGTTTSINSTNLDVTDKLIAVNRGGTTAASANGGGLFISGADASLTWDNGNSRLSVNQPFNVAGNITTTGTVDGIDVAGQDAKLVSLLAATSSFLTAHPSITEASANLSNSGRTYIQSITLDSNGHVTAVSTGTETVTDTNTFRTVTAGGNTLGSTETLAFTAGTNVTITETGGAVTINATDTDTVYTLPEATATVRGGIELFSDTDQSVAANTVTSTANRTYGIQLNSDGQAVVNVPWEDTTYSAGTGIDVSSNTFSVDVSDFMTNGADNRVVTATGTDGMNAENGLTYSTTSNVSTLNLTKQGHQVIKLDAGTFGSSSIVLNANSTGGRNVIEATNDLYIERLGSTKIQVTSTGVDVTGALTATGDITAYYSSDERLKDNVTPIENATDKVKAIGGYTFEWKEGIEDITNKTGKDIGVIAQEIEEVAPELVHTRDNGYKGVDYPKLVALLIESNKELIKRVEELESKQ